jgi:hypothetical protein
VTEWEDAVPDATHDAEVAAARAAVAAVDPAFVVDSFVASLRRRDLPARSAFGSLVVLRHLPAHAWQRSAHFAGERCGVCGLPRTRRADDDFDAEDAVGGYPFQTNHTDVQYATGDLATFPGRRVPEVDDDDRAVLRTLLDAIDALPAEAQLAELSKAVASVVRSNKHQRMILLEVLGFAGVLRPAGHDTYADGWVTRDDANIRQPANRNKREWAYPVRFWQGTDGVDRVQVEHWFGRHLGTTVGR